MKNLILFCTCAAIAAFVVGCGPNVKIVQFDTRPQGFFKGDSVKLYWIVENADSVTLDGMPVSKDSGWVRVKLDTTKTFELRAVNGHSERVNKMHIVQ